MMTAYGTSRPALSGALGRSALFCAAIICLSSSFDVFLTVQLGGTFRACQIASIPLLFLAIVKQLRSGHVPTLGLAPAALWLVFQVCFVPTTDFWPRSVGYCLWLALNLGLLFSFVQVFGDSISRTVTLLRCYIWSFAWVGAFGIAQFLLPIFGMPSPLVQQWWIPGILPRANGFNYEPSYFATYLLIGCVFVNALRRSRSRLLSSGKLRLISLLCGIAIVLSSSRMGIVFLILELVIPHLKEMVGVAGKLIRQRITVRTMRRLLPAIATLILVALMGISSVSLLERNPALVLLFLNGTGISDTAAHSVLQREDAFSDTLTVFTQHPLIGRSLGGVASAIADLHGEQIASFEQSKLFEGMSIYAEALAASGIIGVIPFLWFSVVVIRKPLVLARAADPELAAVLHAGVRALVFALAILQFNQNILRPYLWVHLAVLATSYSLALRTAPDRAARRRTSAPDANTRESTLHTRSR